MRGPDIPAGETVSQIVGNVDLAPTFAAMAGVEPPNFVDGRSFLPLAEHPAAKTPWRNAYLVEHWPQNGATNEAGPAPLEPPDIDQRNATAPVRPLSRALRTIPEYHGVRTQRYLYVEYATGERELYDLRTDPYELHNIVTVAPPRLVDALHREVAGLERCRAADCRAIEDTPLP